MNHFKNIQNYLNAGVFHPTLFGEQILNSVLSFVMIREIISVSSISYISNFNTLIVICYSLLTIVRLFLQNSISKGMIEAKAVLQNICKSILLQALFGMALIILVISLTEINLYLATFLLFSILSMDFIRYFYLFTRRIMPSLIGNLATVFITLLGFTFFSETIFESDELIMIWIMLNLIFVVITISIGASSKYRSPSDLFSDRSFGEKFKLILADSVIIQLFQSIYSLSLLFFVPEVNAASRIGTQVFLSIPNLFIASTAPLLALYVSKGLISYGYRFKLMLGQLMFFLIPPVLILLPENYLDALAGTSDRFYLKYQIGLIANGMSLFVISSFSYGFISLVGAQHYFKIKILLLSATLLMPILLLPLCGLAFFNIFALITFFLSIQILGKYIRAN